MRLYSETLMDLDPRLEIISRRLRGIKVLAISSPKGGVGKSLISVSLALAMAKHGLDVGLLDLDITNPSLHRLLGLDVYREKPKEEKGVVAINVHGLEFMSIAFYTGSTVVPLRGREIVDAIRELLAITRWNRAKVLIIDTPPGFSDEVLELQVLIPHISFLVVTTSSPLAVDVATKTLQLVKAMNANILGVVENMVLDEPKFRDICKDLGIEYLGYIPFIKELYLKPTIENIKRYLATHIEGIVEKLRKYL